MNLDPNLKQADVPASTSGAGAAASTSGEDDVTGLPAFSTWRKVYGFVVVVFVVYVVLLSVLSRVYA